MKNSVKAAIGAVVAVLILGAVHFAVATHLRVDAAAMQKLRKSCTTELRTAAKGNPDAIVPLLQGWAEEMTWRARVHGKFPFIWNTKITHEPRVPVDHVEYMIEDALRILAGNGYPDEVHQGYIRKVIAFAESFESRCSKEDAKALNERLLDAHFLVNDFDGAVAILESGALQRSETWTKAAVAKIRAHQAEAALAKAEAAHDEAAKAAALAEALKEFTAFGEAMAAEPDNGPECDPTSGVAYSRSWVLAKNAKRCADYSELLGKKDEAAAQLEKARQLYAQALKDTADDDRSLEVLKEEMKKAGLGQ